MDTQMLTDQLFGKALTTFPPLQGTQVTGRKADVIKAAHLCAEAALRLVKPGNQVSCLVQLQSFIEPKMHSGCTAILY